ncbi:MAG: hypothetical protein FWH18_05170 [Marinilabiliaceae bacterium]|nr:hypothetical protein [Marinilabiliaceae bacterium]
METKVRGSAIKFGHIKNREKIFVDIPKTDMLFFSLFADKMGWKLDNKQDLWDKYIKNSPENVDLSEEEILEEVKAVRYGKVSNNN